ncbi:MAG: hypothetical protein SF066_06060 [Thermoanaerobaculia bacterium]|nr:hypothetical protein [Thermoanaerobaculia bacterium]
MSEPWNPSPPPPPPMNPPGGYMPPPPMNSGNVHAKVQPAAIGLMIAGGVGILLGLFSLLSSVLGLGAWTMPDLGGDNEQFARLLQSSTGAFGMIMNVLGLAVCAFVIWSGLQMKSLKGWQMCMAGSIAAMIPCFGCYLIGIPMGIWALVVLLKPEVKAAFTA